MERSCMERYCKKNGVRYTKRRGVSELFQKKGGKDIVFTKIHCEKRV